MASYSLLNHLFQIAYVTNDLDQAMDMVARRYRVSGFHVMRDIDVGSGTQAIALAYAGDMMIELIDPGSGKLPLYANWIAGHSKFVLRQHHFGMLIKNAEDWSTMRAAVIDAGWQIPLEGSRPGVFDYLYADATGEFGHFLEYIRLDAGGRAMFDAIPRPKG